MIHSGRTRIKSERILCGYTVKHPIHDTYSFEKSEVDVIWMLDGFCRAELFIAGELIDEGSRFTSDKIGIKIAVQECGIDRVAKWGLEECNKVTIQVKLQVQKRAIKLHPEKSYTGRYCYSTFETQLSTGSEDELDRLAEYWKGNLDEYPLVTSLASNIQVGECIIWDSSVGGTLDDALVIAQESFPMLFNDHDGWSYPAHEEPTE